MQKLKIPIGSVITLFILFLFINSCKKASKKYSRDLFVGAWREARHGDDPYFDERQAITLSLNDDNTFSLSIPSSRLSLSGTWSINDVDTTTLLILKNRLEINTSNDYDNYHQNHFRDKYYRYYFYRVNNAVKSKIYLTDISTEYDSESYKEHLLKPQE